jgi:rubredoxin
MKSLKAEFILVAVFIVGCHSNESGQPDVEVPSKAESARQVALCPICRQPLWKHDLPGFECIELDGTKAKVQTLTLQTTRCPVCRYEFKGALPQNVNGKGGVDRDFCIHSTGNNIVNTNLWLCPECGYAARPDAFSPDAKPVGEATKKYVMSTITEPLHRYILVIGGPNSEKPTGGLLKTNPYPDQTKIPDWFKFDCAVKIYIHAETRRNFMAVLYRDAAHACRRELCSDILFPDLPESLQKSMQRMSRYLQEESFNILQAQGISVLDPTAVETDAGILAQAASALLLQAEESRTISHADKRDDNRPIKRHFTTEDTYVLLLRYAGILDRLGKADEAEKALRRSDLVFPHEVKVSNSKQTALLHRIVEDRLICLQKEREYLFNAAEANMSALMAKETKFSNEAPEPVGSDVVILDAAPASYLLGELFRRGGDPAAANAWFSVVDKIVKHRLVLLDDAHEDVTERRAGMVMLQNWIEEQRALVKPTQLPADQHVTDAVNYVLQCCTTK